MTKTSIYALLLTTTLISYASLAADEDATTPASKIRTQISQLKDTPELREAAAQKYRPSDLLSPGSADFYTKLDLVRAKDDRETTKATLQRQLAEIEAQKALDRQREEAARQSERELEELRIRIEAITEQLRTNRASGSEKAARIFELQQREREISEELAREQEKVTREQEKRKEVMTVSSSTIEDFRSRLEASRAEREELQRQLLALNAEKELVSTQKTALERKFAVVESALADHETLTAPTLDGTPTPLRSTRSSDGETTQDTPSAQVNASAHVAPAPAKPKGLQRADFSGTGSRP